MTNSEIKKCEHKSMGIIEYPIWCNECGALKQEGKWIFPTRTPEPTKEGESREICQCKTPRVDHNEPRRLHGSKCVTCGKKIDMFRDSLPHAKTRPEPTKAENGLVCRLIKWDRKKFLELAKKRLMECYKDLNDKSVDYMLCSLLPVLDKFGQEKVLDEYHRHHEIHEGNCITCANMGTPSITKEQLLAILPDRKDLTVHGHENCPECNKVGRNQAIDQMKQRIEELWK